MNDNNRKELLAGAWTASIKMSDEKLDRLRQLSERAEQEPVYLISNTNELDVLAIFDLLKKVNPDLSFQNRDRLLMGDSDKPVEILPNIFLCVSYQLGAFKTDNNTTPGLIEHLSKDAPNPKLISQFNGDKQKAEQLGFTVIEPDEFFADQQSYSLSTL